MSSTVPKVSLQQIVDVLERAVNEIILGYKMIKNNLSGKGRCCNCVIWYFKGFKAKLL